MPGVKRTGEFRRTLRGFFADERGTETLEWGLVCGLLVIGDRAHSGWDVAVDGRAVPWQVANAVLIGVEVPPGSRTVTMQFRQPAVRPALGLSLVSLAGIAFALLPGVRRTASVPAPRV